jgi:hypothetical protein
MSNSWKRTVLGLLAPLHVGFAGLGRKPGGETVLSMLLDETDLASTGITMTTEHTYRTVELDRARKDGSITAVRALRNANVMRSLRISVAPFVSASDAESSVLRAVDNVRFKGRRTPSTDRYLEDMSVPGVSHVLVREIIGDGPRGPGGDRLLAGAVDNYLLRLTFQAQGRIDEQWPWEEITSIATQQALKIRKILNT